MEKERGIIIVGGAIGKTIEVAKLVKETEATVVTPTTHTPITLVNLEEVTDPFKPESIPYKIVETFAIPKYYPAKGSKYHK